MSSILCKHTAGNFFKLNPSLKSKILSNFSNTVDQSPSCRSIFNFHKLNYFFCSFIRQIGFILDFFYELLNILIHGDFTCFFNRFSYRFFNLIEFSKTFFKACSKIIMSNSHMLLLK